MAIKEENKQRDFFTYAQYKHWPEEERWELIHGEAFDMSYGGIGEQQACLRPAPAPGMNHQDISGRIFMQIANFLEGKPCRVFSAPFDVFFPETGESEEKTSTIVQPDLSIICDKSKLSEKGCTGTPDVVIEVISPFSAGHDQIKKLHLYEKHGVKEYWIVHPIDRIVWKYILNKGVYGKASIFDKNGKPGFDLFPDLQLDLYKVFRVDEDVIISEPSPRTYGAGR